MSGVGDLVGRVRSGLDGAGERLRDVVGGIAPNRSGGAEVEAFVALGSNVGDAHETLASAIIALDDADDVRVVDTSGFYETEPVGGVEQPRFLNAVVALVTTLDPHELLALCQQIEARHGRDRRQEERWGPRTLDLDVLLHGDAEVADDDLVVPHPRLHERAFVLVPLIEVAPGRSLPDGRRLADLLVAIAPIEGVELAVRPQGIPGSPAPRPEGPRGPRAMTPEQYAQRRPRGAAPGTER